jgi:hypothetical protein
MADRHLYNQNDLASWVAGVFGAALSMNIPAALISASLGAAFFAAGLAYYIQPSLFIADDALLAMLAPNHSNASAAVLRLLFNPASAQFDLLRTVDVDAAKYVCVNVNAKDESGSYAGYHAFVYTVAVDFARIDDEGRIAQRHAAFSACPMSDEEKVAQQKTSISPGALSLVKAIQKNIPASGDPSTLSKMASQMSAPDKSSSGAPMEQQLGQLGGGPVREGSKGVKSAIRAPDKASEWRSDQPPAAWPTFRSDHPPGRPAAIRTRAEAIALAKDVEDRWEQSKAGNTNVRPSSEEIKEACRALLAINPKDSQFPEAWAAFVRLYKIDHDAGQM